MKILVTGGVGFIGSNIAEKLVKNGEEVGIVDSLYNGYEENLPQGARFWKCDVREQMFGDVVAGFKPEVVVHHAAQMDPRASVESPKFDAEMNVVGSMNVLEQCLKFGVKHLVFASSGAVYGEPKNNPVTEVDVGGPLSPYGVSKLAVENYLRLYEDKLAVTIFRYPNVFGPKQRQLSETGVVAVFCEKMLKNEQVTIYGDGEQKYDFLYVDDVVWANELAIANRYSGTVHLGSELAITINDLCKRLCILTGHEKTVLYGEQKPGEQRAIWHDCIKARETIGWESSTEMGVGLMQTVDWWKQELGK